MSSSHSHDETTPLLQLAPVSKQLGDRRGQFQRQSSITINPSNSNNPSLGLAPLIAGNIIFNIAPSTPIHWIDLIYFNIMLM